jgi:asparagine synthase (glutamine-hydrolysing)
MFSIAYYEKNENELLLAKDFFGTKPLYYSELPEGGIVFASELKTLLIHPLVEKKVHIRGVQEYLINGYTKSPITIYEKVKKLDRSEILTWNNGRISINSYDIDIDKCESSLKEIITEGIRKELVSDLEVGILLSGGLDSSIVAYEMAQLSNKKIKSFSMKFDEKSFDESKYAGKVSEQINSDHYVSNIKRELSSEDIDFALNSMYEPIADYSIIPTFYLAQMASKHVSVCLSGDGADELFGGYPTYKAHKFILDFPLLFTKPFVTIAQLVIKYLPKSSRYQTLSWKLTKVFEVFSLNSMERHNSWMSFIKKEEIKKIMVKSTDIITDNRIMTLNDIIDYDRENYLHSSVLAKVDMASMYHSLEVRPSFLENSIYSFSKKLTTREKVSWNYKTKCILKKTYSKILTPKIINRSKHGFSAPISKWFHTELVQETERMLLDDLFFKQTYINGEEVKKIFIEHRKYVKDNSRELWAIYVLWKYLKGNENEE